MKTRGILFASVPGLLAAGLLLTVPSAADDATVRTRNELSVFPRWASCGIDVLTSPDLDDVRSTLSRGLARGGATTGVVREALLETYGDRVVEDLKPMSYVRVWDPVKECWVWVCVRVSEFQIDFGSDGAVVVTSRDILLMEK